MQHIKRIATVNDLSGFGRCSLTVALPILSAMGFQPCPVPTAVLSAHTGYADPVIRDMTADMAAYLAHWDSLGLDFAGVYTGFLGNEQQADVLAPFLRTVAKQGGLRLVDPAMGDHGRLYATCTEGLVERMKELVSCASVATPNLTELCLLTGYHYGLVKKDHPARRHRESVELMARRLLESGCEAVVVTGIELDDRVENCVLTGRDAQPVWIGSERVERNFAGTGDVFAAVLCGWLLRGVALPQAVERTAAFVYRATKRTAELELPEQDGIEFEPFLPLLCAEK